MDWNERVVSDYNHKHNSRLKRLARDKHSNLLRTFANYGPKNFMILDPGVNLIKLFFIFITEIEVK